MTNFKKLGLLVLAVSIGSTTAVMAGNLSSPSPYQQVLFSTTLGNRLQLIAPQQQDLQGKTTTTKTIKCGDSSGNCGSITHALTAEGNYKFKDTGVYPIITMIVRSDGGKTTRGQFILKPEVLNLVSTGTNIVVNGDDYANQQTCSEQHGRFYQDPAWQGHLAICIGGS